MEEIIFDKSSEEYKAIEWLKNKTNDYSEHSLILHYNNTLYYLIVNLMKKNKKLEEELQKTNDTLDTHNELINHLEERIDRAIEYIEKYKFAYVNPLTKNIYNVSRCDDLLEILKGNKI